MSNLHPTQVSEIGRIIYEERLQEAELSRRLPAINSGKSRPWFFNLSSLFKPKAEKLGQLFYPSLSECK